MRTMHTIVRAGLLLCAGAASCDGDEPGGRACTTTADCAYAEGERCIERICVVGGCINDSECAGSTRCYGGRCRAVCYGDYDCSAGESCLPISGGGHCSSSYDSCTTSAECETWETCIPSGEGVCAGAGSVQVDPSGYSLHIGTTTGGATAAGACAALRACLCETYPPSEICDTLERGFFSETGCRELLADGMCDGGDR